MSEAELSALLRAEAMERALKESSHRIQGLERQLEQALSPLSDTIIRIDQHKQQKGTKLTGEERRTVLHCYEVCREEKHRGSVVSTMDPILRTGVYFGMSPHTVRDAVLGKNLEDRRGMYSRFSSVRLMASDLRQRAAKLNFSGSAVTLKRLHKFVRETWPLPFKVPGRETIRKMMCSMGYKYRDADKSMNFVETADIR